MAGNQHVVPNPNGGWSVKGEGNKRATKVTDTQADAIKVATDIAKNNSSEVLIHGKNGRIRERNTFGNDPFPPKG
ncbi:hypothetical protein AT575_09680 [Streptococcus penaeicida]|uniref:DUF2188 domain-containing protein n=1 Tax=Streptococcus penaeicida TaxID=1765960 RepID=A0A2N8LA51_9STRE|nr:MULTISPECIES: DUF2188 domain-containing protein [Streptococcus]MCK1207576.1 DUF2188 domain-containing protein [Streptococcus uberis]PND47041.1 hypothetical protein AT575_09680 [Streptococcus penaeicida]